MQEVGSKQEQGQEKWWGAAPSTWEAQAHSGRQVRRRRAVAGCRTTVRCEAFCALLSPVLPSTFLQSLERRLGQRGEREERKGKGGKRGLTACRSGPVLVPRAGAWALG